MESKLEQKCSHFYQTIPTPYRFLVSFRVCFQAVRCAERFVTIVDFAGKRSLARMRPDVRLQMMRCGKCFATFILLTSTEGEATENKQQNNIFA